MHTVTVSSTMDYEYIVVQQLLKRRFHLVDSLNKYPSKIKNIENIHEERFGIKKRDFY